MDIFVFGVLAFASAVVLGAGVAARNSSAVALGGLLLILVSVFAFTDGISFVSGYSEVVTPANTSIVPSFDYVTNGGLTYWCSNGTVWWTLIDGWNCDDPNATLMNSAWFSNITTVINTTTYATSNETKTVLNLLTTVPMVAGGVPTLAGAFFVVLALVGFLAVASLVPELRGRGGE